MSPQPPVGGGGGHRPLVLDLAAFRSEVSIADRAYLGGWYVVANALFKRWWFPRRLRPGLLRAFGANIGAFAVIRSDVSVLAPNRLTLGDNCWIGEGASLINHAPVVLGSNVCVSQAVIICSSGHDPGRADFPYRHRAVTVGDSCWLGVGALVLPGSAVAAGTLVSGGSTVRPPGS